MIMKTEALNKKKLYVQPKMKVCVIDACDIIATSNPEDPDEIGVNLRD